MSFENAIAHTDTLETIIESYNTNIAAVTKATVKKEAPEQARLLSFTFFHRFSLLYFLLCMQDKSEAEEAYDMLVEAQATLEQLEVKLNGKWSDETPLGQVLKNISAITEARDTGNKTDNGDIIFTEEYTDHMAHYAAVRPNFFLNFILIESLFHPSLHR